MHPSFLFKIKKAAIVKSNEINSITIFYISFFLSLSLSLSLSLFFSLFLSLSFSLSLFLTLSLSLTGEFVYGAPCSLVREREGEREREKRAESAGML
jgi:hypothetical protein